MVDSMTRGMLDAHIETLERDLAAALARAEQAEAELARIRAALRCYPDSDAASLAETLVTRSGQCDRAEDRAERAERERDAALARAEQAERRLAEARPVVAAAWALAARCSCSCEYCEALARASDALSPETRAWAEGKSEPVAPALDVADVLPLVHEALRWRDVSWCVAGHEALAAVVDALPPTWREAAAKGGGR